MTMETASSAVRFDAAESRRRSKKKSVGFGEGIDEDEETSTTHVKLSFDPSARRASEQHFTNKKARQKKSLSFSAGSFEVSKRMTPGHHKFGEDGKSYSMSETDPKLLIIANLFVQELLIRATEEARLRQCSENQVLIFWRQNFKLCISCKQTGFFREPK